VWCGPDDFRRTFVLAGSASTKCTINPAGKTHVVIPIEISTEQLRSAAEFLTTTRSIF
jgi:hypothetical protein